MEHRACQNPGLTLEAVKLEAIRPPQKSELLKMMEIFASHRQPLLIHCKSGADRAGLASAFYQIEFLGLPISQAKKMLSLKFGHFRKSRTSVLDHILECYERATLRRPQTVRHWLRTSYDEDQIQKEFNALRKKPGIFRL